MIDLNKNRRRFDFFFFKKNSSKITGVFALEARHGDRLEDRKFVLLEGETERANFMQRREWLWGAFKREREREGEGFVEKARHRNCRFPTRLF